MSTENTPQTAAAWRETKMRGCQDTEHCMIAYECMICQWSGYRS